MTPAGTDRAVMALGENAYRLAVLAGQIGYVLEMQLDSCIDHQDTVAVITHVVRDGDDPAFRSPLHPFVEHLYAMDPPLPRVRGTGVPGALRLAGANGLECDIDFEGATYFLFVAIWRNSANPVDILRLPDRRAITMGWEVRL